MPGTNERFIAHIHEKRPQTVTESSKYSQLPHIYQRKNVAAKFLYLCSSQANAFACAAFVISDLSNKQDDCRLVYYAIRVIIRLRLRIGVCVCVCVWVKVWAEM